MSPPRGWPALAAVLLLPHVVIGDGRLGRGDDFVELSTLAPGVRLDIRYATPQNFTKQALYPEARCRLRRAVAERLARVQGALAQEGLGLLVFDCWRPLSVQRRLWALIPDERYVADPKKGSRHNRGAAVDLTLVDGGGRPLAMGSDYDAFTPASHRGFPGLDGAARANRARLDRAMAKEGFVGLPTEWWHFDAPDWERFPIDDD